MPFCINRCFFLDLRRRHRRSSNLAASAAFFQRRQGRNNRGGSAARVGRRQKEVREREVKRWASHFFFRPNKSHFPPALPLLEWNNRLTAASDGATRDVPLAAQPSISPLLTLLSKKKKKERLRAVRDYLNGKNKMPKCAFLHSYGRESAVFWFFFLYLLYLSVSLVPQAHVKVRRQTRPRGRWH